MVFLYAFLYLAAAATVFGWLSRLAYLEGRHDLRRIIFVAALLWPLSLIAGWVFSNTKG